jgi:two-component system sensor histidine kinase HydH
VGANFLLNQNFYRKIEAEKKQQLDEHLQALEEKILDFPENEISEDAVEKLFYALVEENRDFRIGFINKTNNLAVVVAWDYDLGEPTSLETTALLEQEFEKGRDGNRLPEVMRDRDKIKSMRPVYVGENLLGIIWIEDSIISDIRIFVIVRILTGIAVLFSILAGIFGVVYIIRKLMKDIKKINDGIEKMKDDLSYRIDESSNELGQIAGEINLMADKLEEQKLLEERLHKADKMAALGQFVSGIAHELRNPLGIMKGSLQLMEREGSFSDEDSKFIKIINEQIERQNLVIEELLKFAKPSEPNFESLALDDVLDSIMSFAGAYLREAEIELYRLRSAEPIVVNGDREKLKQVFLNLILNAVQAMPEGGTLSIETEEMGVKGAAVHFRDSGKGISEDNLVDIFNPYFTTKDKGTGLGLSISYQLVELHGGTIKAENLDEGGAEFTVALPSQKGEGEHHV